MNKEQLEKLKNEPWYQRLETEDKFGEDLQGDCIFFIESLLLKKKHPRLVIERYGMDDYGHITFIDLHDEKFGEAIFFGEGSRHYHGFYNKGKYNGN